MALTFREQLAGFPVRQMLVVSLIRFSEPLAFTSLFPYLYFMIRDFQIAPTEQEISKYSGYLASSFAFCQFLCAVQWKSAEQSGQKADFAIRTLWHLAFPSPIWVQHQLLYGTWC